MRTAKREEKKKGRESIFKTKMTKNFSNLGRETSRFMRLKESPNRLKSSTATLKHYQIQKQRNQKKTCYTVNSVQFEN